MVRERDWWNDACRVEAGAPSRIQRGFAHGKRVGIAYNVAKIRERMPDAPLDSWAMMFDPTVAARFADCGITMVDQGDDVVSSALFYLGRNPNSETREDLTAAVPSALIAHVDGEAAGWVKVAPRPAQPRLAGYPLDTEIKRFSSNELFHGTLSAFLGAGFTETARPGAARPIVAKALT